MRIPQYNRRSGGRRGLGALGGRFTLILAIIGLIALFWFSNQQEGLVGGRKQMITMGLEDEVRLGR
jgi:hypothetical protein